MNERNPTILERDDIFTLAEWHNVFALLWHGQADTARARRMAQAYHQVVTNHPEGVLVMVILTTKQRPPDSETREYILQAMQANNERTLGLGYVLQGTGFTAAALRAVVTSTVMIARPPYPTKVFASIDEAATWATNQLGSRVPSRFTASELAKALQQLWDRT